MKQWYALYVFLYSYITNTTPAMRLFYYSKAVDAALQIVYDRWGSNNKS